MHSLSSTNASRHLNLPVPDHYNFEDVMGSNLCLPGLAVLASVCLSQMFVVMYLQSILVCLLKVNRNVYNTL